MSNRIAIVGVGRMGANMARRLKDSGFDVTAVYDLRRKQAKALAQELGCESPLRLSAVTALADVILTVVSDDASMEALFAQKGDSLLKGAAGRLFINCATVSPATHVMVETRAQAVGAESVEACMASSITQARQGTLYLMTAGQKSSCERAEPILATLSASRRYIGAAGTAAQVKALVNMVMNINTAGLAEGLGLASSLDLDLKTVMEIKQNISN